MFHNGETFVLTIVWVKLTTRRLTKDIESSLKPREQNAELNW